jgi:hypothetical protein
MADSYLGVLRRLKAYLHKEEAYEKDHIFSLEDLAAALTSLLMISRGGYPRRPTAHPEQVRTAIQLYAGLEGTRIR